MSPASRGLEPGAPREPLEPAGLADLGPAADGPSRSARMTTNSSRCSIGPQLQIGDDAAGADDARRLGERGDEVGRELQRVDRGGDVEAPSSHGSCSIGPTRRSAPGTRRRAISIMPSAASMPADLRAAPGRQRAQLAAAAADVEHAHARRRSRRRSASASRAGAANAPHCSAQPAARALHSGPSVPAVVAT